MLYRWAASSWSSMWEFLKKASRVKVECWGQTPQGETVEWFVFYLFLYSDACFLVPLMSKCGPVSLGALPVNTAHPAMSLCVGVGLLNVAWRLQYQGQQPPGGVRLLTLHGLPNSPTAIARPSHASLPSFIFIILLFYFHVVVLCVSGFMKDEKKECGSFLFFRCRTFIH